MKHFPSKVICMYNCHGIFMRTNNDSPEVKNHKFARGFEGMLPLEIKKKMVQFGAFWSVFFSIL